MDQAEKLRRLARMREAEHEGPVVATVVSGKGGTGKTSFCINFAIALSMLGKSVMIIDADFGLSNVDVMLGASPKYHIGDVLAGKVTLREAASRGHGNIWYVAGGAGVEELLNMRQGMLDALHGQVMELDADMDYILFDCGAGVNSLVLRLMEVTDESILLVTPEPTAIADGFVLMKSFNGAGKARPPVRFVMNRSENSFEAMTMARHFKNIVRKYLDYDMKYLGYVSFDKSVMHAIKKQMPVMLSYPNSQAAKDMQRIAEQYAKAEAHKGGGLRKLFDRMLMRNGK